MCEIFAEDGILIFDSDVLIWFFHGNTNAQQKVLLSSSMEMGDALIAATCLKYEEILCIANDKHYKVIPDLNLDIFRP